MDLPAKYRRMGFGRMGSTTYYPTLIDNVGLPLAVDLGRFSITFENSTC
jgi:hypothetical protein